MPDPWRSVGFEFFFGHRTRIGALLSIPRNQAFKISLSLRVTTSASPG